jgi:hypothetical protein
MNNDHTRPYIARADFMFGGVPVVIDDNVPKLHVGTELNWQTTDWFERLRYMIFGVTPEPRFTIGKDIKLDQCLVIHDKYYMSRHMFELLKTQVKT